VRITTLQVPVVREIAEKCPGDGRLHWLGPVADPTYPKIEVRFQKLIVGNKPTWLPAVNGPRL
jgi:hypothetical protein